jgi:MOSC domain-containing protein YiiM
LAVWTRFCKEALRRGSIRTEATHDYYDLEVDRCGECGFLEEEYDSVGVRFLREELSERLRLSYEPSAPEERGLEGQVGRLLAGGRLHEAHHLVHVVTRTRATAALDGRRLTGTIARINVSDGGVPKLPVEFGVVGWRGLEGDRQRDRKHHGHPGQALCLYSLEIIEALRAEGHPIEPGCVGENLTLSGLDWGSLRPGTRFCAGQGVVFQITEPAVPCKNQTRWFEGGDYRRMSYDHHPGWSRWYAAVLSPGRIATGDAVESMSDPVTTGFTISEAG